MQEMKPIKEGKVREIYDNGDSLIMVATDRISCFDVILNNVVSKGTVLTQMSKFWFNLTEGYPSEPHDFYRRKKICRNFSSRKFDGNSMMCRKLNMIPVSVSCRLYHRKRLGKLSEDR